MTKKKKAAEKKAAGGGKATEDETGDGSSGEAPAGVAPAPAAAAPPADPPAVDSAVPEATSPSVGDLGVGDAVEIFGLQGAKELNGRRGRIVAYVEESARFGVRLEGDDDTKAVKPANLRRIERTPVASKAPVSTMAASIATLERNTLEKLLADVVNRLKKAEEGSEERGTLQKQLADLVQRLKKLDEEHEARMKAKAAPPPVRQGPATPITLQPPPPPREQHHPVRAREIQPPEQLPMPRVERSVPPVYRTQPPQLPERPSPQARLLAAPPVYEDENEYPDPTRAHRSARVAAGAVLCGILASQAELCPATWFVWSFLLVHLVGVIFLTDYAREGGLVVLCATFGLHAGVALSELVMWMLDRDGADSVGPWSLLVFFACVLYLHSFWTECLTLPPDYITSISFFFPMFPAFNAAIAMSCLELFVEWRYFPNHKLWGPAVFLGAALMAVGQVLMHLACRFGERNFWASCRNMPEEEEKPEDFVGLEIPNRRIVQEGPFRWERHPAYLGAMLWGIGAEVALCNPFMLIVVGFVLWASLLYVTIEEEQELYDEFKGGYASYCALTNCWIPLFNSFLENTAFQREMSDNCEGADGIDEEVDEEEEGEEEEEVQSEDDLLPTWEGVPKGGALWNRQFREPWMLG
mmetsp:Transcript_22545/g.49839  ORF Transcript_22545/g.49839 Transcript_22545/m.49839 type:complete len:640 (-) Transcript_22545:37-1956(-)|eukprot:CAMPEP_0170605294 /NCGR_PEP_ID=MMETSP0224-20130122/19898_1 /TAXON_ID=285029 /ORGANISM="Togula jolla, Strain CCCM 725" /LENGTH=639 /DNA_ID=CAMNT_0010930291 /DNA_START=54 /DNA_END=1973 /DNA_ORIENTATION=-